MINLKHREETLNTRLLLALIGLAVSPVVSAIAQEQNTVDPEVHQQIEAVHMKFVEAQNKGDAAAIAALFTQDAVQVWYGLSEGGLASGQQAIEKRYRATFAAPSPSTVRLFRCSQSAAIHARSQ